MFLTEPPAKPNQTGFWQKFFMVMTRFPAAFTRVAVPRRRAMDIFIYK